MKLQLLDDFARRHHGLVTLAAAQRLGISRSSWYRAIESGQLLTVFAGVARTIGAPATFSQRALAAVWAAGPDAMTSHRTSAAQWEVPRPEDDPIDVMLSERSRHSLPDGIVVHRPRDLKDLRPIVRWGIPTTDPLRMLLDLGAVDPDAVPDAMIRLISTRVVSPKAIVSTLYRHSRRGRHGITAFRRAYESWASEELPPDSVLEAKMHELAVRHGLPRMEFHAVVEGFEVDFLVAGTTVIIECDGWATHGLDRDQFEYDRRRNASLVARGYHIVHVTWRRLTDAPADVAADILDVLRRWHPEVFARHAG